MRNEQEMMNLILDTAKNDDRIRAVYMSGSRIDANATHDIYSDFDIVYIVRDIKSFTNNERWLDRFGEILIMQKPEDWYNHPYDYNSNKKFVYLMQFKDGNRIDLTLVDVENIAEIIKNAEPREVLLDKDGIDGLCSIEVGDYYNIRKPTFEEFRDCCNEFWWLSISVAKGLCREELMYVKFFMEHYQMAMFLKMLSWKIGIGYEFSVSTGKYYKYLKRYLSSSDMNRFENVFPGASYNEIWDKFFNFCEYFNELALEVSKHFKFEYCTQQAEDIMNYLKNMRAQFKI